MIISNENILNPIKSDDSSIKNKVTNGNVSATFDNKFNLNNQTNFFNVHPSDLPNCIFYNSFNTSGTNVVSYEGYAGSTYGSLSWGIGKTGSCIVLNGTDSYVNFGHPSGLNSIQVPMTITGWFKPDLIVNARPTIISQYSDVISNNLIKLVRTDNNYLNYFSSKANGTYQVFSSSNKINLGSWNFFVIAVSGTTTTPSLNLYLNGIKTPNYPTALSSTPNPNVDIEIGQSAVNNSDELFKGKIDEIAIYNRVLSDSEINKLNALGFYSGIILKEVN